MGMRRAAITRWKAWSFKRDLERWHYPCDDCGVPTAPGDAPDEWCTVLDPVWDSSGMDSRGILCIGCLERRLGRQLTGRDFEPALLNSPDYGWHSARLIDRLKR